MPSRVRSRRRARDGADARLRQLSWDRPKGSSRPPGTRVDPLRRRGNGRTSVPGGRPGCDTAPWHSTAAHDAGAEEQFLVLLDAGLGDRFLIAIGTELDAGGGEQREKVRLRHIAESLDRVLAQDAKRLRELKRNPFSHAVVDDANLQRLVLVLMLMAMFVTMLGTVIVTVSGHAFFACHCSNPLSYFCFIEAVEPHYKKKSLNRQVPKLQTSSGRVHVTSQNQALIRQPFQARADVVHLLTQDLRRFRRADFASLHHEFQDVPRVFAQLRSDELRILRVPNHQRPIARYCRRMQVVQHILRRHIRNADPSATSKLTRQLHHALTRERRIHAPHALERYPNHHCLGTHGRGARDLLARLRAFLTPPGFRPAVEDVGEEAYVQRHRVHWTH